jgi:quinol monooxygenase YgiN
MPPGASTGPIGSCCTLYLTRNSENAFGGRWYAGRVLPDDAVKEGGMLKKIVRLAVDITVKESQLNAFKKLAQAMTSGSAAEPGTLGYEWFFSEDGVRCRLLETYAGAEAVSAHFKGPVVTQLVPQMVPLCTMDRFEIYGDPGPEVAQIARGWGAQIFSYWAGLDR